MVNRRQLVRSAAAVLALTTVVLLLPRTGPPQATRSSLLHSDDVLRQPSSEPRDRETDKSRTADSGVTGDHYPYPVDEQSRQASGQARFFAGVLERARHLRPQGNSKHIVSTTYDFTRRDGRVIVPHAQGTTPRQHPVPFLMKRAERQWSNLKNRQSRNFKEAVVEYKRRYGFAPPKGFDKWYAFARASGVQFIDEYDIINDALLPFRAFKPESFKRRVEFLTKWPVTTFGFELKVRNGKLEVLGNAREHQRAQDVASLLDRFVHVLPDFRSYHTAHDGPHIWRSGDERARLVEHVLRGHYDPLDDALDDDGAEFLSKAEAPPIGPMPQTCSPGTAMREAGFDFGAAARDANATAMPALPVDAAQTFIYNQNKHMDFCDSPQYRHTHAATSWQYPLPGPFLPILSPAPLANFGDIPALVPEQFDNFDEDEELSIPWESRTDVRLVFRGQTSGPYWNKFWPWKSSQRARLHLLGQERDGARRIMLADAERNIRQVTIANRVLNEAFVDMGMVGPPVQCDAADGTCEEMAQVFNGFKPRLSLEQSRKYRFEFDVDGNSWSGRSRRLMLSSAVVFKATVYPQFWHATAIPWLHYVPVQVDYSDLWDILAYFRGGLYGEDAHDDEAKKIALAGREWARTCYRWEDLEVYMFRLILEYARVESGGLPGKGTMDFDGDGSGPEPIWKEM